MYLVLILRLAHADAPSAYPEIHHATLPLPTAAVANADPGAKGLWAGQNHRAPQEVVAGEVVDHLRSQLVLSRREGPETHRSVR